MVMMKKKRKKKKSVKSVCIYEGLNNIALKEKNACVCSCVCVSVARSLSLSLSNMAWTAQLDQLVSESSQGFLPLYSI